ncbi:MAG: TolC family protein [Sphingobacteriaceae bacterium]
MKKNNLLFFVLWCLLGCTTLQAQELKKLSLQEAISLGIQNSKALGIAKSKALSAQAKSEQLRALQFPQVKASASYARLSNVPEFIFPGYTQSMFPNIPNSSRYGLSLVQPVSGGFRARAMLESGELLAKAAALDAEKDQAEITLNISTGYYALYRVQETKKLIDQHVLLAQKRLADIQNLAKNGLVAKNDVLRAELQVSTLKLNQLDAQNALEVSTYNYALLLGLPESTAIEAELIANSPEKVKNYDEFLNDGLNKRSDYKAAELRLQSAKNNIKVAKASYYPVISLNANYLNANPNQRLIPVQARWFNTWDAGITLSYDITGLFTNKHQLADIKAQYQQAELLSNQVRDGVKMEVHQQYLTYSQQQEKLDLCGQALSQATENYRVVKTKYDNQLTLLTEVLDADVLVLQAKLNLAFARADAALAYQKLLKSSGNL